MEKMMTQEKAQNEGERVEGRETSPLPFTDLLSVFGEPWNEAGGAIEDRNGNELASWTGEWPETRMRDADMRRVIACVNACKGIPTELLESVLLLKLIDNVWKSLNSLQKYLDTEHDSGLVHGQNAFATLCEFTREIPHDVILALMEEGKIELNARLSDG